MIRAFGAHSCQPRIRWDLRSRTMIPAFGRRSSLRRFHSEKRRPCASWWELRRPPASAVVYLQTMTDERLPRVPVIAEPVVRDLFPEHDAEPIDPVPLDG